MVQGSLVGSPLPVSFFVLSSFFPHVLHVLMSASVAWIGVGGLPFCTSIPFFSALLYFLYHFFLVNILKPSSSSRYVHSSLSHYLLQNLGGCGQSVRLPCGRSWVRVPAEANTKLFVSFCRAVKRQRFCTLNTNDTKPRQPTTLLTNALHVGTGSRSVYTRCRSFPPEWHIVPSKKRFPPTSYTCPSL